MENIKFEFIAHEVGVEIQGKQYFVDCSTDAQGFVRKQNEKMKQLLDEIRAGEKSEEDAVSLLAETLAYVFRGEGVDGLLSGRSVDDLSDLAVFVAGVFERFNRNRLRLIGKPTNHAGGYKGGRNGKGKRRR